MKLKRLAPWNWFKSEEPKHEEQRKWGPRSGGATYPISLLHREMDRLFDDFQTSRWPALSSYFDALEEGSALLKPMVDISESEKHYTIKVEVPGVEKEDVKVEIQDDTLFIHGEKRREKEETNDRFHRTECSYGSFQRVLNLPPDAKSDDIKAKFRRGILTLTVAKTGEKQSSGRAIEID